MIKISRLDAMAHIKAQTVVAAQATDKLVQAAKLEIACPLQRSLCEEAAVLLSAAKIMAHDSAQFVDPNEAVAQ